MKTYVYSFLKVLTCIILLNSWIILYAQNGPTIQDEHEDGKDEIAMQTPSAIPVLSQEDAKQANINAIAYQEEMKAHLEEMKVSEISQTIIHRKIHQFYKSISLLLIVIIHISFIGYINYFRRKLKIHWTNIVMFGACTLAIIMMISGILHIIMITTYLVFWGGMALTFAGLFYADKRLTIPSWTTIQKTFFRPEYALVLCGAIGSFIVFTSYQVEIGQNDVWTAWYHQYLYIVKHGCWTNSGYSNYASAYAMITNGVSAYFAFLLHDYGTQLWTWSHLWFCIMMLMPIFQTVKWNNVPEYEIFVSAYLFLCYRLYSKSLPTLFFVAAFLSIFLVVRRILKTSKRSLYISNSIVLFIGLALCFYVITCLVSFFNYPMDNVLGCATIGVFFSFAWKMLVFGPFNWYTFLFVIPLVVLSLIKPTGVIPALLLSLYYAFGIIYYTRTYYSRSDRKKKHIILSISLLIVVISSPLATNGLWNAYASSCGLVYQHSVSAGTMATNALYQIRNGCSEEDYEAWQKKISDMSLIVGYSLLDKENQENKSFFERYLGTICINFFKNHPFFDFDKRLSHPVKGKSHVAIVSFILIIFSVLCLFVCKNRFVYFSLICWTILSYSFFVVNQYYLAPMFTNIPGLFRYFYPAYTIVLGLSFLGLFWVFYKSRLIYGLLLSAFLSIVLIPHFCFTIHSPLDSYKDSTQSWTGYILLAEKNAEQETLFHFANPWAEGCCLHCLQLLTSTKYNKYYLPQYLPKQIDAEAYFEVIASTARSTNWKYPSIQKPGIYLAVPNNDSKEIALSPIFTNNDGVSLLNEVYYFSDFKSFEYPPWIEKSLVNLDGKRWSIPTNNKSIEENSNKISVSPMEKKLILWDTTTKFCFAQDSIRFVGKYSKDMSFSLVLGLYEKSDEDQKYHWIKQYPINISAISPVNKKEVEFKADFNLADITTDKLNLYYRIGIVLEPGTEGTMRDFHLYQYVSGKLNLKQALAELEQTEQTDDQIKEAQ